MPPNFFISAGESSGDRYGAALARAIKAREPAARIAGLGGSRMAEAGVELVRDVVGHAVMGIWGVVRNFRTLHSIYRDAVSAMKQMQPDVFVPIDNPGMNLRLSAAAGRLGARVVYYVSPQIWAWYSSRIHRIARLVDRMLVILPFEKALYEAYGVPCDFVGHPMVDYLRERSLSEEVLAELSRGEGPLVGLLPGSRRQEVAKTFPIIAEAAAMLCRRGPGFRFAVGCADAEHVEAIEATLAKFGVKASILLDRTFELMEASRICIAVSGTATLELCSFEKPSVVVYRAPALAKPLVKLFLKTRHVALANIIAGKEVLPEFLLFRPNAAPVAEAAERLLRDEEAWERCRVELGEVKRSLGEPGASQRAADAILHEARSKGGN